MNLVLINLIKKILEKKLSGVLIGEKNGIKRELFIEKEVIVFSKSTAEEEHLGNILFSLNLINEESYKNLHQYINNALSKGEKLGRKLVQEGIITPTQLLTALKYQLKKISLALIYEDNLDYKFIKKKIKLPPDSLINVPLIEILLEAIEFGEINQEIKELFQGEIIKTKGDERFNLFLTKKERELLSFLDSPKKSEEIIKKYGENSLRILFKLYIFGFVKVEQEDKKEKKEEELVSEDFLSELNDLYLLAENEEYSKILPKAPEKRKKKYLELVKKFHPDRLPSNISEEIKRKVETVFDAINKANQLKVELKEEEEDKAVDHEKLVKQTIQRAKFLFKQKAYQQAVSLLESVINYVKTDNYEAYFVLALGQSKIDHYKKAAEENFLKAISLNKWYAEPYFYLAKLYEEEGLKSRAIALLEKAIQKFPNDEKINSLYNKLTRPTKKLFPFFKK